MHEAGARDGGACVGVVEDEFEGAFLAGEGGGDVEGGDCADGFPVDDTREAGGVVGYAAGADVVVDEVGGGDGVGGGGPAFFFSERGGAGEAEKSECGKGKGLHFGT